MRGKDKKGAYMSTSNTYTPDTDETKFCNSDTSPRLIILPSRDRDRFRDSESVPIETESETNTIK